MRILNLIFLTSLLPAAIGQEGLMLRTTGRAETSPDGPGVSAPLAADTWVWATESRLSKFRVFDAATGEYVMISEQLLELFEVTVDQQQQLQKAKTLRDSAREKIQAGDYTAALPLWQSNLQIRRHVLPAEHPYLASDLTDVAACLDALGRTTESLRMLQQAAVIRTHILGDAHAASIRALRNLALALHHAEDNLEAFKLHRRIVKACDAVYGRFHAETAAALGDFGVFRLQCGDDREAVNKFLAALDVHENIEPARSEQAADAMHNLAVAYDNLNEHDSAEKYYRQAIDLRAELLGPQHPLTAESVFMLGWLYDELEDFPRAQRQYQRALDVFQQDADLHQPQLLQTMDHLGRLYARFEHPAKARPLLLQVLALQEQTLGREHADTINTLAELALVLHAMNDHKRAQTLFESSLELRSRVLGPEHPDTIVSLFNLAWFHDECDDNRRALELYQTVLRLRRKHFGSEDGETLEAVRHLGLVYAELKQDERAERLLREVLTAQQAVHGQDHVETATAFADLGWFYNTMGEFEKATPLIERSLAINERLFGPDHENTAHACMDIGRLYERSEDFHRALPYLQRAVKIFTDTLGDQHPQTAIALHDLAILQLSLGDYGQARGLASRALKIREQREASHGDSDDTIRVLDTLGWACDRSGDYSMAQRVFRRALEMSIRRHGEDHEQTAACLFSLGSANGSLGEYAEAESLMQQALSIRRKRLGEQSEAVGDSLLNLGWLRFQQQQYEPAERLFAQAAEIYTDVHGAHHSVTSIARINLAEIYQQQGKFKQSESTLNGELKVCRDRFGPRHPRCADILRVLGRVSLDQRDFGQATQRLQQALDIDRRVFAADHPTIATDLELLSVTAAAAGNMTQAVRLREESRQVVRRHMAVLLPGLSQQSQQKYLATSFRPEFAATLSLALHRKDDPRAAMLSAGWLLNGKGVAQEVLAESALLSSADTAPLVLQLRTVRNDIARLAVQQSAKSEQQRRERLAALEARQHALQRKIAERGLGINGADPWIAAGTVQSALPFESVFVNIARFAVGDVRSPGAAARPDRYVAWLMPASGAGDVRVVDLGAAAPIDELVSTLRQQIQSAPFEVAKTGEVGTTANFQTSVAEVSRAVLHPLLAELEDTEELIISPDSELWMLPWNALLLPDGRYLVEQYRTRFVLSGRELARRLPERSAISAPVLFADPNFDLQAEADDESMLGDDRLRAVTHGRFVRLAASAAEAAAIRPSVEGYTGTAASVFLQNAALEAAFKNLHRPQVLLLSTHGYFEQSGHTAKDAAGNVTGFGNPLLRCGLALAGCNARMSPQDAGANTDHSAVEDGILTGLEIVGTDLRGTELVVLSACETGLGVVRDGEGVAGLRQAFQLAGAQSVVSSLWQVADGETARLMDLFFQNLNRGMSKSAALRAAQLTRIKARRERHGAAHPFFWAAFTLTGRN
ncbi:MAG: CHAT domain-containing protein [Planctomycetaceae bacterium]|nr:CHAT domain-containing protein [Planctomycetaceae bacterium]